MFILLRKKSHRGIFAHRKAHFLRRFYGQSNQGNLFLATLLMLPWEEKHNLFFLVVFLPRRQFCVRFESCISLSHLDSFFQHTHESRLAGEKQILRRNNHEIREWLVTKSLPSLFFKGIIVLLFIEGDKIGIPETLFIAVNTLGKKAYCCSMY